MKPKRSFMAMLTLLLIVAVTAACGTSTQVTPAATAEKAESAPAPTEVIAPTAAPKALPDLSTARISLADLPEGFEEIDMQDIAAANDDENMPDVFFTFINKENFQVIMGMNFLLVDTVDRIGYGAAFRDSESTLQEFAGAMGAANIREVEQLSGLETIGDKQEAMTMVSDVEGVPMRVDAMMFQRGDVGSILLTMRVDGDSGGVSIENLGSMLDQQIQESLTASE